MDSPAGSAGEGESRFFAGWLVFLAAVVPHLWTCSLEFAGDDYGVIAAARFQCGLAPTAPRPDFERSGDAAERAALPPESNAAAATENYLFRPVVAAWWVALVEIGGGRAEGTVFRIGNLLLHGFTAWLLYRLLGRFLPPIAAALGAGWFGFAPAAHQAFTWIAAGGDLWSTTLALGGAHLLLNGAGRDDARGRIALLAGAACTGATVGAKESAVVLVPFVFLTFLLLGRPGPRRFFVAAAAAAAVVFFFLLWRAAYLGHWFPQYPQERPFGAHVFRSIPAMLGQMLAPVNRAAAYVELRPFSWRFASLVGGGDDAEIAARGRLFAGIAAAPVALGLFALRGRVVAALVAAAATVAALLPAAWIVFRDDGSFNFSRNAYHAAAPLAALLGIAAAPFARRGVARAAAVCLPLALFAADAVIHVARVERSAAREIAARLAAVREIGDAEPAGTRLVVIDPDDGVADASVPLIGVGYPWAFSALFTRRPIPVERWYGRDEAALEDLAAREPSRVVFLERSGSGFARAGDPLLAGPAEARLAADPQDSATYRPVEPSPARAVRTVVLPAQPSGGDVRAWWTYAAADGRELPPAAGAVAVVAAEGLAVAPAPAEALLRPLSLRSIRFEGLRAEGAPSALRREPWLKLVRGVGSGSGGRLGVGGVPEVAFRPPWPTASYRIEFRIALPGAEPSIVYSFGAESCRAEPDGVLVWRAAPGDHVEAAREFGGYGRIELLEPLWAATARSVGIKRVMVRYRVEGVGAGMRLCRSPWAVFALVEKDG